jgi:hypothetical protein
MHSKHTIDLGILGEHECDVESAVTIVRKESEDNYSSVEIIKVTLLLDEFRLDLTPLLSDEAVDKLQEEILDSVSNTSTKKAYATL